MKDNKNAEKKPIIIPDDFDKVFTGEMSKKEFINLYSWLMKECVEKRLDARSMSSINSYFKNVMDSMGWITKAPLIMQQTEPKEDTPMDLKILARETKNMNPELRAAVVGYLREKAGKNKEGI